MQSQQMIPKHTRKKLCDDECFPLVLIHISILTDIHLSKWHNKEKVHENWSDMIVTCSS